MELLASKFSWSILEKLILQALQEPSKTANEAGGGVTDGVRGVDQQQGGVVELMHSNSCRDLEEQANSSSGGNVSAQPLPAEEMSEYEKIRAANMKQKERMPRQLKRDWRGFKQSEGFVAGGSLKGAKKLRVVEKESFNTRRRAKELKAVGKEVAQPRSVKNVAVKDPLPGQRTKQDLGTRGTGLDNGYLETIMQLRKVAFLLGSLEAKDQLLVRSFFFLFYNW